MNAALLLMQNITALASADIAGSIANEPGWVAPLATLFGKMCNFIFNLIYSPGTGGTLAITIILFTIVTKMLMLPLSWHQQKMSSVTRKLQPEMKKIQDKYAKSKDADAQTRMNMEIQALQKKHGYNPLMGCLPLLIQLPIIYGLFFVMRETYLYIDAVGGLYDQISSLLLQIEDIGPRITPLVDSVKQLADKYDQGFFDIGIQGNCQFVLSKVTSADIMGILNGAPADIVDQLTPLLAQKTSIETFFGLSLIERPGISWPGIVIPILAAGFSYLSMWIMNRHQSGAQNNLNDAMQGSQKMMSVMMPALSAWMAITFPTGLGLYWIMTYVFQVIQQVLLHRIFMRKEEKGEAR